MATHIFTKLNASRRHPHMFTSLSGDTPVPKQARSYNTIEALQQMGFGLELACLHCHTRGRTGDANFEALLPTTRLAALRFGCPKCGHTTVDQNPGTNIPTSWPVFQTLPLVPDSELDRPKPTLVRRGDKGKTDPLTEHLDDDTLQAVGLQDDEDEEKDDSYNKEDAPAPSTPPRKRGGGR